MLMLLQLERTYFRLLHPTDKEALFEIYSDKEAMQYRTTPPFETIEEIDPYLAQVAQENQMGQKFRCAIVHTATNQLMGTAVYTLLDATTVEIGFSIGRSFWKGGYGTEGTWGLIELIKQREPQIKRIVGIAQKANEKSVRMMEHMHFTFVKEQENKIYFEYLL